MRAMTERPDPAACSIANAATYLNAIRRICLLILCLATLPVSVAAETSDRDVYTVSGVAVDETAETAAAAREQALAAGHRAAFARLLARLVPRAMRQNMPVLDARQIAPLVLSFGIDEEKTSNVRYLAKLTFRFRRGEVREFVRQSGAQLAETRSKPVLVLPVFNDAGALSLWDEPNPWFAAWKTIPTADGLVPMRLPAGDLADIRDVSAEQAAHAEEEPLAAIADRYGVSGVIVARAALAFDSGSGRRSIEVSTNFSGVSFGERTAVRSFAFEEGETLEAATVRAARALFVQIEEDWKRDNLLRFDRPNALIAVVSLTGLGEWVDIRSRLREVAFLRQAQLVSASRERMTVRLNYYGDAEQLRVALAQRDLVLERGPVNWTLRDAVVATTSPSAPEPATAPAPPGRPDTPGAAEPAKPNGAGR